MAGMPVSGVSAVEGSVQPWTMISCTNEREPGATVSVNFMLFSTVLLSN